jgi:amino acid adenylation domain-containing protein
VITARHLADYLEASAARCPDRHAIVDSKGSHVTYAELNHQADALAAFLTARGVKRGDRVGVVLPKSISAVVSLFGIMKAGAAYVPVDYTAPAERGRRILTDCQVSALIVDARCLGVIPEQHGASTPLCAVVAVGAVPDVPALGNRMTSFDDALKSSQGRGGPSGPLSEGDRLNGLERNSADLAYIVYTSGSTGMPKGVMLTHENALSFVEWCSSVFEPTDNDRFSGHAPFHFDLSVLDIYVAIKHGAALYLISEDLGKNPKDLARFIAVNQLTVWYSTPSILTLLLQFGNLEAHKVPDLRLVLFAGEVFPVKHLRELQRRWPSPAYYNLYGPTETNVCTFAKIPSQVPDDREVPYPIGFACSHCASLVLDDERCEVAAGDEGLLYISGPSTFRGYWNRPAENAAAFLERSGVRWYNTGDLVRWDPDDGFIYAGRKDRMVKRRGYRIELGEIERALYSHPRLREVAVISVPDPDAGVKIVAYLSCHEGDRPSIIDLKTFCGTRLPAYMNPDRFMFEARLPRTSTDKVDYLALKNSFLTPAAV